MQTEQQPKEPFFHSEAGVVTPDQSLLYAGLSWRDAPRATLSLAISAYWYASTFNNANMPEHFRTYAISRAIQLKKDSTVPLFFSDVDEVLLVADHLTNFADVRAHGIADPRQKTDQHHAETAAQMPARKIFQKVDRAIRVGGNQSLIAAITVGETLMTDLVHELSLQKSSEIVKKNTEMNE